MPIKKAALKSLRQTKSRTAHNRTEKESLRKLYKHTRIALDAKNIADAKTSTLAVIKALDKAAQHKTLKKNAASRRKSRLMKRLNALSAA